MSTLYLSYLPFLIMFIFLIIDNRNKKKCIDAVISKRMGDNEMNELAKRFLGKDVYINLLPSATVDGVLKEIVDNSIIIEKDGKENIVNLDYVVRLREYPTDKKGKKKQVVLD